MRNQIVSELLYHSLFEEEIKMEEELEDELEHHGVKDMSWGERNGPPYPLRGIDKKIARAQYRKEKERKKRLKKLQKAAKKARKLKQKEERTQEQIRKKKQQLVKKGDLAEIRKNINLFTNEELEYIVNRDEQKRQLKSNKERDTDEKMELFMKRFTQVADMAANAQKVLGAVKVGSEIVGQVKANKVKDIEAEEKQWSRYQKEFEARNKIDPEDARGYLEFITGGTTYRGGQQKQPKPEKKSLFGKKKDKQQNQNMEEVLRAIDNKNEEKRVIQEILNIGKDFPTDSKGTENLRKYVLSDRNKWSQRSVTAIETEPATNSGKKYALSDRNKWSQKKVNFKSASDANTVPEAKNASKYTLSDRNKWSSKPVSSIVNEPSNSTGKKYTLSDRNKWSSKPVTALVNSMETRTKNNAIHFISESNLQKPKIQIGSISPDRARARDLAYQSRNYEKALSDILPKTWHAPAPKRYSYQYIPPERMAELRSLAGDMGYYDMVAKNSHKGYGDVVPNSVDRAFRSLSPKETTFVEKLIRKRGW